MHLAAHLPTTSHDQENRFLRTSSLPANQLRELVQPLLHAAPEAFLLLDDNVQDKRYSHFIALTKRHGSGYGLSQPSAQQRRGGYFLPLDYRIYAPEEDQKMMNDHFLDFFDSVI